MAITKKLSIYVDSQLWEHPQIVELRDKGHMVCTGTVAESLSLSTYDLILSSKSWRLIPGMEAQQIPLAVKAARKEKYGIKEGIKDEEL